LFIYPSCLLVLVANDGRCRARSMEQRARRICVGYGPIWCNFGRAIPHPMASKQIRHCTMSPNSVISNSSPGCYSMLLASRWMVACRACMAVGLAALSGMFRWCVCATSAPGATCSGGRQELRVVATRCQAGSCGFQCCCAHVPWHLQLGAPWLRDQRAGAPHWRLAAYLKDCAVLGAIHHGQTYKTDLTLP
jgi:hypothetical protein